MTKKSKSVLRGPALLPFFKNSVMTSASYQPGKFTENNIYILCGCFNQHQRSLPQNFLGKAGRLVQLSRSGFYLFHLHIF